MPRSSPSASENGQERVAIWCAVSSEEQADPDLPSLDEQERIGRQHAEHEGDVVVQVLRAEGFSRFQDSLVRMAETCKDYRQLVHLIETDAVTKIICHFYHRLWRTPGLQGQFCALAANHDVWIYCATEPVGRGADQTAMWIQGISGIRAEQEIRDLVERRRMGMRGRARAGKVVTTRRPYGYLLEGHDRDRHLVICEEERPWVVRIMEWCAQGDGCTRIATRLNEMGCRNPSHPRGIWLPRTIAIICDNPCYAGYVRFREWPRRPKAPKRGRPIVHIHKGEHEPLISEELWQAVQRQRQARRRDYAKKGSPPGLFTGLLRCAFCGDAMVLRRSRGIYVCGSYRRYGGPKSARKPLSCRQNPYPADVLREYAINFLRQALDDPEAWARTLEAPDEAEAREREIAGLEREMAGIRLRRTNLLDAIETASDGQDRDEFVRRYDLWTHKLDALEAQVRELREAGQRIKRTTRVLMSWSEVADEIAGWSDERLRPVLRQLIHTITLERGKPPVIRLLGQ